LTILITEKDVSRLLEMKEAVSVVEEAFRREGAGEAINSPRTRSVAPGSSLSVMHAVLPYLRRGGTKAYMSSHRGTSFVFVLFDASASTPLAVIGADVLGRIRTGAASAVATRHLFRERSASLAVFGSGKQALTQVTALAQVLAVESVKVWSPTASHRDAFVGTLREEGFRASASETPAGALEGAVVGTTVTSSSAPFIDAEPLTGVRHLNLCGGNNPRHAEVTPGAVGSFDAVVVDDLPQARLEYGDLLQAEAAGAFSWESAIELKAVVAGKSSPRGRTLFKSGGAALEDVAVASLVYDRAKKLGGFVEFDVS
jgi:ornithine cyclodeaminase/alanine dehydrogenase-like protein (mu-crystallin family)